jgi:hypothetical protein
MAKRKLFIGSSQKNLRVAGVLAEALEESAQVHVWNGGVFGLVRRRSRHTEGAQVGIQSDV